MMICVVVVPKTTDNDVRFDKIKHRRGPLLHMYVGTNTLIGYVRLVTYALLFSRSILIFWYLP